MHLSIIIQMGEYVGILKRWLHKSLTVQRSTCDSLGRRSSRSPKMLSVLLVIVYLLTLARACAAKGIVVGRSVGRLVDRFVGRSVRTFSREPWLL